MASRATALATSPPRYALNFLADQTFDEGGKVLVEPLFQHGTQELAGNILNGPFAGGATDEHIGKAAERRFGTRRSFGRHHPDIALGAAEAVRLRQRGGRCMGQFARGPFATIE